MELAEIKELDNISYRTLLDLQINLNESKVFEIINKILTDKCEGRESKR
jgi:hypothetical protein